MIGGTQREDAWEAENTQHALGSAVYIHRENVRDVIVAWNVTHEVEWCGDKGNGASRPELTPSNQKPL